MAHGWKIRSASGITRQCRMKCQPAGMLQDTLTLVICCCDMALFIWKWHRKIDADMLFVVQWNSQYTILFELSLMTLHVIFPCDGNTIARKREQCQWLVETTYEQYRASRHARTNFAVQHVSRFQKIWYATSWWRTGPRMMHMSLVGDWVGAAPW